MSDKMLYELTIDDLSAKIANKEISPVELTRSVLDRANETEADINAYISVMHEQALQFAKQAEEDLMKKIYKGPLHGIPLAIKDNIDITGVATTNGSIIHKDFIPQKNARVIDKLLDTGMIPIGKTNLHEYANGITTNNRFFGATHNPWDTSRIVGGSSGGSAAALAAHSTIAAIGTDTAGSVRIPSACCGTVGLKPTFGSVSIQGVFPLSWSLDHVGPMTKTVKDASLMIDAMTEKQLAANEENSSNDLRGKVIGIPEEAFLQIDEDVKKGLEHIIRSLKALHAEVRPVKIASAKHVPVVALATYSVEGATIHHEQLLKRPEDYSPDVKRYFKFGETITGVQYLQSQQLRKEIIADLKGIFQSYDAILFPTIPVPAPKINQLELDINGEKWDIDQAMERFNSLANVSGFPSLAMPSGFSANNLPVGVQFLGNAFADKTLLDIGIKLENYHNQ